MVVNRVAFLLEASVVVLNLTAAESWAADRLRIDGLFDDWPESVVVAEDPADDSTGSFDLTNVSAMSRGAVLYLRFDTGQVLNIQNGPKSEGTLLIHIGMPDGHRLTIDTRGRRAFRNGNRDRRLHWSELAYISGPTYASDQFELKVDLARFGVRRGSDVTVQFGGSDSLERAATVQLLMRPKTRSADHRIARQTRMYASPTSIPGGVVLKPLTERWRWAVYFGR